MRSPLARTGTGRRGPGRAMLALPAAAALLALGVAPAAARSAAGAGAHRPSAAADTAVVENRAYLTYRAADGAERSAAAAAAVTVRRPAVEVVPSYEAVLEPGGRRAFAHRVRNGGAAAGRFRLEASAPAGWRASLFLDVDGDGELGERDAALSGPLALEGGASAALLMLVEVPLDWAGGEAEAVLRATSEADPAVTAAATDRITVARGRTAATLEKTADRADALRGDTLAYTLSYANRGVAVFPDARLQDPLPRGLRFVPGSLRWNGAALTDAADADAGTVERDPAGRQTVSVRLGALAPGAAGTVAFRATVEADAAEGPVANVAVLTLGDNQVASTPAETRVGEGRLEVGKERVGSGSVPAGGEVVYRLTWANRSAAPVRDAALVDTLPAEMALVHAEGSPETEGRVVRWRLGTLQPGAAGAFTLTARVSPSAREGAALVNRAVASGGGVAAAVAEAAPVTVLPRAAGGLELRKTAGSLEAGVGETVVYTLAVRNPGDAPLEEVVVRDLLPVGTRLAEGSVWGADSVRTVGRELRFFVPALAAGAERTVRYALALVSPGREGSLGNRAWAEAAGGVRSDTAAAWVRLRRGHALQGRTLIGKVWLDEDGDGRQGPGEKGVAGAAVWSADGEVVTTDREGRFSFRDLSAGTHVLRLDTLGLPAGYTTARPGEELLTVRMDGWTAPRAAFRLVRRLPGSTAEGGGASAGPSAGGEAERGAAPEARGKAPPRIEPLRSAAERQAEERGAFLEGPGVAIFAPADGAVIGTNRLYVGVRGEPGAPVRLYDGGRLVGEGTLRPDGALDFIGVEVEPGPHRLRVWTLNSWKRERWDSVAVHRSGQAAAIELPAKAPVLRADSRAAERLRLRVVDRWGVAVADTPNVTVEARGARVDGADVDASSVGMQLRTGADGWLELTLRGGREVGTGELRLAADGARATLPLRILPFVRPLIATGAAQAGVGAAPEAFGAVTVQGAVDEETSVTLSWDSRRGGGEDGFFGRGYDPLDEGRYPTVGDGSERRALAGATQTLSARVERGFDWLELGDVQTAGFGSDGSLGAYRRALTGVSGRVSGGALAWSGFGSVTDQAMEQRQVRGDGSSGPYRLAGGIRPGTERVAIEVRAADNAARVVARQELSRFADYQVDYLTGAVLLQRPVPATDPQGNPVFVVASFERRSGGEARFVGGLRMELDARRALALRGVDSLGVGFFGVRDAAGPGASPFGALPGAAAAYDLFGGDFRVRSGRLEAAGELLRSAGDSAAAAARAEVAWSLPGDRVRLDAGWLHVGDGFAASANPRLVSEMDELRVSAAAKLATGSTVGVRHERQAFHEYGVERSATYATAEQEVAGRKLRAEGGVASDLQAAAGGPASSALGKATLGMTPELEVWVEGSRLLRSEAGSPARPDHLGAGASYRVLPGIRVEGAHRRVSPGQDSAAYAFTALGVRVESVLGGQVWSSVEHSGGEAAARSLAMGWNQRLSVTGGWALTSLFERRFGLSRAPLADPLRALPFARPERDRWSAGLGLEWLPADSSGRFSARGEVHDGEERSGYRFDVAGDLPLGPSMALLTRHDWSSAEWPGAGGGQRTRRDRSLVGFALRPVGSDAVNALARLEWRRSADPHLGGDVLTQARDESRLIGSADVVWAPAAHAELAGRYAARRSMTGDTLPGASDVRSLAHFLGARYGQALHGAWSARLDGRMLLEGTTGTARWSATPSLVVRLGPQLEVEGGWRLGDLRDPDFYAFGGGGPFAALGIRLTEGTLAGSASFWRERIRREY